MATEVSINDLSTWLSNQPANTKDTPYEITITGLTTSNYNDIKTALISNSTKYVDLSTTSIPNGVTDMTATFQGCSKLVNAPAIPNGVTNMTETFFFCESLVDAPVIPDSVTDMSYTFFDCKSLVDAPVIPNGVIDMTGTFQECTSLVNAPVIPNSVTTMVYTFGDCASLVDAPIIPNSVNDMSTAFTGCTSLVDAPIIPDSVTSIIGTFEYCTALVNAPAIPNGVIEVDYAFYDCTSLVNAPIIPDSVTTMSHTFAGCTSLSYKPIIPSTVTTSTNCYEDVPTDNWGGTEEQVSTFLPSITTDCEVYVIDVFTKLKTIYRVDIENLSALLQGMVENDTTTPYLISISQLTTSNITEIKASLNLNLTKFVDLSYTTIPENSNLRQLFENCQTLIVGPVLPQVCDSTNGMRSMFERCSNLREIPGIPDAADYQNLNRAFIYCSSLIVAPELPSNVSDLTACFAYCTSLRVAPQFPAQNYATVVEMFGGCSSLEVVPNMPNSVDMTGMFYDCTSLVTAPYIPEGVEIIEGMFNGCSHLISVPNIPSTVAVGKNAFWSCPELVSIDRFAVPLAILKNNADFENMFADCGALERIGYIVSEAEDWHVFRLKVSSGNYDEVEGKVYDREGNSVSIPTTTLTLGTLTIPVLVDELWFPPSNMLDADIDDVIEEVIACRYSYFNKMVVNPNKKSFVLYADDPDEVITNLNLGGTDIAVYPTLADAEADLTNLNEGDFIATEQGGDGVTDVIAEGEMRAVTSNAVANALSYSTIEVLTGGTWIDGKPIYRKVVTGSATVSAGGTTSLAPYSEFSNIGQLIKLEGFVHPSSTFWLPMNCSTERIFITDTTYHGLIYNSNAARTNVPYIIILEYTKTS